MGLAWLDRRSNTIFTIGLKSVLGNILSGRYIT